MSQARPVSSEISPAPRGRTRSPSTVSSSGSSSSRDSVEQAPKPIYTKGHKKSNSFSKFFASKEPSLAAFERLADLQQKELEKKGQKVPFGVPQAKLPDTLKDDYKNAKQRAKERAKLHEQVKEKLRIQEEHEEVRHRRKASISDPISITPEDGITSHDYFRSPSQPIPQPPTSPKSPKHNPNRTDSRLRKLPSLDELPETRSIDAVAAMPVQQVLPPSPPASYHSRSSSTKITGVLTGSSRQEALPWE